MIPNLNYIASANCVIYLGNSYFIDTNENSPSINIKKLENYLKKNTKIKNNKCINIKTKKIHSIITTHIFGHIEEIDKLKFLASKFKLKLIEDASEALEAFIKISMPVLLETWGWLVLMEIKLWQQEEVVQ